tara:strand:+ start:379 stop:696 length:318 start_codon:yes stop_codon:yes gene_type:complete
MTLLIKPTKVEAARALAAKANFHLNYDTDKIVFTDLKGDSEPSESAINTKYTELLNAYNAEKYKRDRKPLYPDIGDQLDDLYKKGAFSTDMAAKIKKVKDDNPKP